MNQNTEINDKSDIDYWNDIEKQYDDILSDPQRMENELYDEQDKQRLKIGNYEEIYDPVQREKTNAGYIKRFYGEEILLRMKREAKESKVLGSGIKKGYVSKGLYGIMKDICRKKGKKLKDPFSVQKEREHQAEEYAKYYDLAVAEQETTAIIKTNVDSVPGENIQRQRQNGDDYFTMIERGLFRNPEFRKIFKGPFLVYGWLWTNLVRKGWNDKAGYPIKAEYYDKGLLAYCSSYSRIAKDCFMDKDTVATYIKRFHENGIIEVEHLLPVGKKRGQNVYILGKWKSVNGKPKETFYINQVLLSGKDGDLW